MPRSERLLFPKRERVEDRRKEGDQRKLLDEFFDHRTLVTISRLISQSQFDALDFPISTGKEGGVFRASIGAEFRAVKVYRIGNAVFRRLPAYALEELKRESSERNYARLVYAWTRREHTTLRRMRAAGVPCPEVYGYLRNVLVMEFIGEEGLPAPRLQDAVVEQPSEFAARLTSAIHAMVVGARLVHGDLSPYNVLYLSGGPILIDVAQAVSVEHPQARDLLRRDSDNFAKYLKKLGADIEPEAFFTAIGGEGLPRAG